MASTQSALMAALYAAPVPTATLADLPATQTGRAAERGARVLADLDSTQTDWLTAALLSPTPPRWLDTDRVTVCRLLCTELVDRPRSVA